MKSPVVSSPLTIAVMFRRGMDTCSIAVAIGKPESVVYSKLGYGLEALRNQPSKRTLFDAKRSADRAAASS